MTDPEPGMETIATVKGKGLKGEVVPPPDKSLSHRAIMFASVAAGKSAIRNVLDAEDPRNTLHAFRMLGVAIEERAVRRPPGVLDELLIHGKGLHGLREPLDVIDCGNSGTTMRLLSGILAGNPFFSVLTGDDSLKLRPMARIIHPLREMGAEISGRDHDRYPPVAIKGKRLVPLRHAMPVASAQLKSCLLLAGLYADGVTTVTEPYRSRDHTERMLKAMGAGIEMHDLSVSVNGDGTLGPLDLSIPADFSSAAFFILAALIVPGSELVLRGVGINRTRTGFLDVARRMGGRIEVTDTRTVSGEPVGDISCSFSGDLRGIAIGKDSIPGLIDEFPALCVLATQAEGITEIRGAEELRVKESDRIRAMATELRKLGVELEEYPDGIAIQGKAGLKGCAVESYGDHRIAMALSIAALVSDGATSVRNASCVDISFPGFFGALRGLVAP